MAKFGLFSPSTTKPEQEYEGEHLEVSAHGESVCVVENDAKAIKRIVAVIRLAQGQSVKKIN